MTTMATSNDHTDTSAVCAGSDTFYNNICQPCHKHDHKILEAEGRCTDCDEFLCKPCFQAHTVPSVTRHHVMIGKDDLGKDETVTRKDQCTKKCPKHDEIIKHHCPTHYLLGCSTCIILDHESCKGKVYIPEAAKNILNSEAYKEYKERKTAIETKTRAISENAEERINAVNITHSTAIVNFRCFKNEILDWLEQSEKRLVEECNQMKEDEVNKQRSVQKKCATIEKEMFAMPNTVELFESKKQFCNMYAELIKVNERMLTYEASLDGMDQRNFPYKKMHFSRSQHLIDGMSDQNDMGRIEQEITEVKYDSSIEVKTKSDTRTCWITSAVILKDSKLIIADRMNAKLKLVDIIHNKVIDELQLASIPRDMTIIHSDEVAITVHNTIDFFKTDGKLVKHREIQVNGESEGVAFMDGNLFVTFWYPPRVVMMDMQGVVLQTVASNDTQKGLLSQPLYAVASPINKTIYISDAEVRKVMCLKSNGTLLSSYTDTDLERPTGMAVDSQGMVYVCDWVKHKIHQITKDCKKQRVLLTQPDVTNPYSVAFSDREDKLYVGMRDCNVVKVFRVV